MLLTQTCLSEILTKKNELCLFLIYKSSLAFKYNQVGKHLFNNKKFELLMIKFLRCKKNQICLD